jgi:undecaprenyl-diphosphatase
VVTSSSSPAGSSHTLLAGPGATHLVRAFDDAVDRQFDRLRGHRLADRLFYGASAVGDHGMLWVMLGALRGLRGDHHWRAAVRVGVGVGLESVLINVGVKSLFRRQRPVSTVPRPLPLRIPLTSSFPSGHATSAFCAAALLSDGDAALAPLYYGLAAVVSASRVYVRIHHASDVVGGVAIGALLGRAGRQLVPLAHPVDD